MKFLVFEPDHWISGFLLSYMKKEKIEFELGTFDKPYEEQIDQVKPTHILCCSNQHKVLEISFYSNSQNIKFNYVGLAFPELKILENILYIEVVRPIWNKTHPENYIDKLLAKKKVNIQQEKISVLDELLVYAYSLIKRDFKGPYDLVNKETISDNEILKLYRRHVDDSVVFDKIDNPPNATEGNKPVDDLFKYRMEAKSSVELTLQHYNK